MQYGASLGNVANIQAAGVVLARVSLVGYRTSFAPHCIIEALLRSVLRSHDCSPPLVLLEEHSFPPSPPSVFQRRQRLVDLHDVEHLCLHIP